MKTNKPVSADSEDEALFSFRKKQISAEKIEAHWKIIQEKIQQYEKEKYTKKGSEGL